MNRVACASLWKAKAIRSLYTTALTATASRSAILHQGASAAATQLQPQVPFIDYEYIDSLNGGFNSPVVNTTVPGPCSKQLIKELGQIQQTMTIHFFGDYERSRGNFLVDVDGNAFLDLFGQIGSLPVGYNNPTVREGVLSHANTALLSSRPAMGMMPPAHYVRQLQETLLSVAPQGLKRVQPMMCGTCSNENAMKAAFIAYMTRLRGGTPAMDSELVHSALLNKEPGCPKIGILSFLGGFHGRTIGCLSATHTKPLHKLDIPALDWPMAEYPKLRYPLEEYERENRQEENRCLELVHEEFVKSRQDGGVPIAGVIVEPIQAEGGDNHATPYFFRELQQICIMNGAAFIVDEVQTGGGATGYMWTHESWDLPTPPEIVTFSKKFQIGGFYYKDDTFQPKESFRIFNTWLGDPSRMMVLESVLKEMRRNNLLELVKETGSVLYGGLRKLEQLYPSVIHNTRGIGTFCAVSFNDTKTRDKVLYNLKQQGIVIHVCGDTSIRFRPSLILLPKHVNFFLNCFEKELQAIH